MRQILRCSVKKLSAFFSEVHFCNANDSAINMDCKEIQQILINEHF